MDTMTRLLILTVRTFPALTRTKNVSLLTPSIFAACGMDTPICGRDSVSSFFGFSGGVLIGIRMPVFELIGIVIICCVLWYFQLGAKCAPIKRYSLGVGGHCSIGGFVYLYKIYKPRFSSMRQFFYSNLNPVIVFIFGVERD